MTYVRHTSQRDCICDDCKEGNRLLDQQRVRVRAARQETARMTDTEKAQGLCRGTTLDFISYNAREIVEAKQLCESCPVRKPCLLEALDNFEHGVWGGTTWTERETIRRKVRRLREKKVA